MKTIEEMLRSLARTDVTEFAVVSDRLPCVRQAGSFLPIDDTAPTTDTILEMLVSAGGSRYVDSLGPKPVNWTLRVDGVGTVSVSAIMRDEIVQARFVVAKRAPGARVPEAARAPEPARAAEPARPQAPELESAGKVGARPDFDPRARGSRNLSPPPARPAAAAGLSGLEAEFDFEAKPPPAVAPPLDLDFDGALDAEDFEEIEPAPASPIVSAMVAPPAAAPAAAPRGLTPAPFVAPVAPAAAPRGLTPAPFAAPVAPRGLTPAPFAAPAAPKPAPARRGPPASASPFEQLLWMARGAGASDLHIVSERPALIRVAGELAPTGDRIDESAVERLVDALVPARLRAVLDADGSCDFAITDSSGRSRVNVSKQRTGLKICARLIPAEVPTLESLGLPPQIGDATHHHQGLILVTGPTGHGKTSTLAAIVDIINRETTHHVITVEDPVEYVHARKKAMMSQREVGTNTRTFASALKGSLREDPDVIVVGELRDTETVRMALSASETGHLMIGTMNTPSAAKTIDRLIDLFPPADQAQVRLSLAGGLRLIVSQRLIPNTDRTGLVAACEVLPGSVSLWSLIRDNKTYQIPSLQQRGKGLGITRFDDSLIDLVKAGRTSLDIAKEWAESAEEVEMTVLNKRPVAVNPMAQQQGKPMGEGAREAMAGILGKAGNLFRKGG